MVTLLSKLLPLYDLKKPGAVYSNLFLKWRKNKPDQLTRANIKISLGQFDQVLNL
jgi:hypothetical protein